RCGSTPSAATPTPAAASPACGQAPTAGRPRRRPHPPWRTPTRPSARGRVTRASGGYRRRAGGAAARHAPRPGRARRAQPAGPAVSASVQGSWWRRKESGQLWMLWRVTPRESATLDHRGAGIDLQDSEGAAVQAAVAGLPELRPQPAALGYGQETDARGGPPP